ncbi:uncharacterized protein LOC117611102 isoform X3 [Osmia lignaria lignaria]|uniref:uncharacterized protein LOC117611102 isoform X3 n=1 Tax=Osmia lignaria lignaria TaxID=1437193 RepID=UPI00402BD6B6
MYIISVYTYISTCDSAVLMWKIERVKYINYTKVQRAVTKCLTWSWYIADNMQFFVFGIFVLILSSSYYYTALSLSIATIFLSMLVHAYITYDTGYIPTLEFTRICSSENHSRLSHRGPIGRSL